ncbi:MAG: hypothetical protein D6743_05280 [Calditrichaeota bacterium]|nr:MAG: hypothetical protein D6743_05280 [Calditrichota bacterium]
MTTKNRLTLSLCTMLLVVLALSPDNMAQAQSSRRRPSRKKISLQFRNANIHDVFKTLSTTGGINIVASKAVQGTVTIFVDSVDVMEALDLVVEMQGLAYYREHGVIKVLTADEYRMRFGRAFKDRLQTKVVRLKYASAEQVVKSVFQMKSKEGNVIADQRSNSLILVDLPAVLRDMETVIHQVDIPLETRSFVLNHIPVQSIEEVVKSMASAGAQVRIDSNTNQLIVMDDPARVQRIAEFVEQVDVPEKTVMEIFSLQYAKAEEVAARLQDELTPGIGSVVADKNTNKLFVRELPDNLPYLRQLIASLDQKTKQVLIEAKIIQISLNDDFKMGVDWSAVSQRLGGVIDASSHFRVLGDNDNGGRVRATAVRVGSTTLSGLIEALQTVGKTNLLSNPRITCVDGQEAYILVGSSVPYKTVDTREDQGGALRTFERVVTVEVGVKLKVTPHINEDGFITMNIRPEVSQVTGFNENVPIIEKSESETTVIVKDGVTIIIGGLIKNQDIESEKRVPLIGSVPLLGIPFRSKTKSKVKSELVILLQPKIISGDVNMGQGQG